MRTQLQPICKVRKTCFITQVSALWTPTQEVCAGSWPLRSQLRSQKMRMRLPWAASQRWWLPKTVLLIRMSHLGMALFWTKCMSRQICGWILLFLTHIIKKRGKEQLFFFNTFRYSSRCAHWAIKCWKAENWNCSRRGWSSKTCYADFFIVSIFANSEFAGMIFGKTDLDKTLLGTFYYVGSILPSSS